MIDPANAAAPLGALLSDATMTTAPAAPAPESASAPADGGDDDSQLVRRAQGGDRAAFEQLVRRTARLVYARAYLDSGDRHRAEDLVQDTFLTAWRRLGQVTDPTGFRAWLLTVARTTATDAHRREARKKRAGPPRALTHTADVATAASDVPDASPTPAQAAERREQHDRMLALLRGLPDEYALPLTLRHVAGADYDTIARQLGVSNGSLRGLLNRGMAKLRELMREDDGGNDAASTRRGVPQ